MVLTRNLILGPRNFCFPNWYFSCKGFSSFTFPFSHGFYWGGVEMVQRAQIPSHLYFWLRSLGKSCFSCQPVDSSFFLSCSISLWSLFLKGFSLAGLCTGLIKVGPNLLATICTNIRTKFVNLLRSSFPRSNRQHFLLLTETIRIGQMYLPWLKLIYLIRRFTPAMIPCPPCFIFFFPLLSKVSCQDPFFSHRDAIKPPGWHKICLIS